MDIRLTNSTTENNEALINVDERALASIIHEFLDAVTPDEKPQDFASAINAFRNMQEDAKAKAEFWNNIVAAKEALRNNVENAVNNCTNCVKLSDIEAQGTTPTATTIPPTQPIAESDVPKEIVAKATTEAKEEKKGTDPEAAKEYATTTEKKEEGIDMEEVIKRAKEEAEAEMSTRMIMFEIGRMAKGELVERAQHWMDTKDPSRIERQTTIHCTKYCVESREAFDCEYAALNTLRAIKNTKFNQFLSILSDVKWICE